MNGKQILSTFFILSLFISVCAFSFVNLASAQTDPEWMSVSIVSPANETSVDSLTTVTFAYHPVLYGSDSFANVDLIVNGSIVASNTTAVANDTTNNIYYAFALNGTYTWDIQLYNSTGSVNATAFGDINLIYVLELVPTPTPTPVPTATPTASPIPTQVPTPTPTPTATPAQTGPLNSLTIAIIAVVVIIVIVVVIALVFTKRKASEGAQLPPPPPVS